jgi:hypothetical protein
MAGVNFISSDKTAVSVASSRTLHTGTHPGSTNRLLMKKILNKYSEQNHDHSQQ